METSGGHEMKQIHWKVQIEAGTKVKKEYGFVALSYKEGLPLWIFSPVDSLSQGILGFLYLWRCMHRKCTGMH